LTSLQIEKLKAEGNLELERSKQAATESLERKKFETSLILDAIKTASRSDAIRNLKFFVAAGFVSDPDGKIVRLDDSILPSISTPSVCLRPGEKIALNSCGNANGTHVVTNMPVGDDLNIRASPNAGGLVTGLLPANATDVVVGKCEAQWCLVQ